MDLMIRPVLPQEQDTACALAVSDEQFHYVEPVSQCLDEAKQFSLWHPVMIMDADTPIGFSMYGKFTDEGEFGRVWLDRLLIDRHFQGRGYGHAALKLLIDKLFEQYGCHELFLSIYPDNARAEALYRQFGFRFNGETDINGELVMRLSKEDHHCAQHGWINHCELSCAVGK